MKKLNFKNLIVNISLLLVTTLICTVLLMFVIEVRYFFQMKQHLSYTWHDPNTQFDPELGWSPVLHRTVNYPDWGMLSSNSHGFRSAEIDQNKKQIIVLGDSVAWGAGVSDTETFPYYLDEMVSNLDYQVSNLAVSGYDLGQYYLFLKRHIDKFNNLKQVILVICPQNDLICTRRNECYGKRKPLFQITNNDLILVNQNIKKYCLRNIFSKSYFLSGYWAFQGIIGKFLSKISGDKTLDSQESLAVSLMLLQKIYELVVSHNAKLLIILSPSRDDFLEKTSYLQWLEYSMNKIKLKDFDFISYVDVIIKDTTLDINNLYLESDQVHFSKTGNMILAKTTYDYLVQSL